MICCTVLELLSVLSLLTGIFWSLFWGRLISVSPLLPWWLAYAWPICSTQYCGLPPAPWCVLVCLSCCVSCRVIAATASSWGRAPCRKEPCLAAPPWAALHHHPLSACALPAPHLHGSKHRKGAVPALCQTSPSNWSFPSSAIWRPKEPSL